MSLSGTKSVDITWTVDPPHIDVPCTKGLHGVCTHLTASGSDKTLGALTLDEFLATPKADSCSTGAVAGTFSMADAASTKMTYKGTGHFCWHSLTGVFHLTLVKGSGRFEGATGALLARITNGTVVADEWTGSMHWRA